MAETTGIEWTDSSWNPIIAVNKQTGKRGWHCVHASEGCRNCYAESLNRYRGTGLGFTAQNTRNVEIKFAPEGGQAALDWPIRAKRPRKIFVCDMSDLFGEFVPDEMIDQVFGVMSLAQHHTFQILTKRPQRMLEYKNDEMRGHRVWETAGRLACEIGRGHLLPITPLWPLPNVWGGPSVEDQKTADERIPLVLQTRVAVRMVSYEPALAGVDFRPWVFEPDAGSWMCERCGFRLHKRIISVAQADVFVDARTDREVCPNDGVTLVPDRRLDWIIVGGESGPGARHFHVDWARDTIRQCREAGVSVFVKQLGSSPLPSALPSDVSVRLIRDKKGGSMAEWPEDLRVREFPS